jgi:2-alkenal reductase
MKRNIVTTLILLIGILALVGLGVSPFSPFAAFAQAQAVSPAEQSVVFTAPRFATIGDLENEFQGIYDQVNLSVVMIEVVTGRTTPGLPLDPRQQGMGSGFVWDTQGYIVTNNHVVEGASQISVTFADGTIVPGKLVGADPHSDLAVVKVEAPAALLHPVQMADSTLVKVGQLAIAIGNPFGEQNTMTTGIISALGRSLPVNMEGSGPSYSIPDVIQTDASINPGNSGGVLLDGRGRLIGVTAAIESPNGTSAGIGFAVPSVIVQKVVPTLIRTGRFDHPYIGISGGTLTPTMAQSMNLKADQRGAIVGSVTSGSPAAKAGLRGSTQSSAGTGAQTALGADVIIAIDGKPVKAFDDLLVYLARSTQVNQTITLTILRDGNEQTVQVTLVARPAR